LLAIGSQPSVVLAHRAPSTTAVAPATVSISTWRDPSHQELNFYQ
jgi:hypothetical protein